MTHTARRATAHHEAGHAVIALHLGMAVRRIKLRPSDGVAGVVEHQNPLKGIRLDIDNSPRANLKAEKAICICLAGPIAQRKYNARTWRHEHGEADHALAADLALSVHGGDLATAYLTWLTAKTKAMLDLPHIWNLVGRVASDLEAKGELTADDVRRLQREQFEAGLKPPAQT